MFKLKGSENKRMASGNKNPSGSISDEERLKRQKEKDPTKAKILKGKTAKMHCPECNRDLSTVNNFYAINQNSKAHKIYAKTGKIPVCKDCIRNATFNSDGSPNPEGFKLACQWFDIPYIKSIALDYMRNDNWNIGIYKKDLILNGTYKEWFYEDGEKFAKEIEDEIEENKKQIKKDEIKKNIIAKSEDKMENNEITTEIIVKPPSQSEKDVMRILGYDPFIYENCDDRENLFNKLIGYLDDEATKEDNFKVLAVIEIVVSFNQADKLNRTLAILMSEASKIAENSAAIKSTIDAKDKILKNVLALAKDNGISVNHNNNKSKGGNTLNGIVKKLTEIGLSEAVVNLYDLETSDAMRQIADISHKSILSQLVLDENDQSDMLAQQRELIRRMDEKTMKLEEENRLLKIKISQIENSL
jgi:hypothetical protein